MQINQLIELGEELYELKWRAEAYDEVADLFDNKRMAVIKEVDHTVEPFKQVSQLIDKVEREAKFAIENMRFVVAQSGDLNRVVELIQTSIKSWHTKETGYETDALVAKWSSLIDEGTVFVLQLNNQEAGILCLTPQTDHMYLSGFYLLPEYHGTAASSLMVQIACTQSLLNNKESINLRVWRKNQRGYNFYKKHGWDVTDSVTVDGIDKLVMSKSLV